MTDLEITDLCGEALGIKITRTSTYTMYEGLPDEGWQKFDPLHDDAQAMALVKKIKLYVCWNQAATEPRWDVFPALSHEQLIKRVSGQIANMGRGAHNEDLNRAICECVAKMKGAA